MSTLLNLDCYRHELYEQQQQQQQQLSSPPQYTILSMDIPPTAATAGAGDQQQQQQQQQPFTLSSERPYNSAASPSSSFASPSSPSSVSTNSSMSPQSNASDTSASYTLQNLNLSNSGGPASMHYPGGAGMSGYQAQQQQPHHQVQQQQHFYAPQILCLDQNNMQQQQYGAFTGSANDAFGSPKPDYGKPHLVILEQPVDKFRFRYQSEMHGTHGSLMGQRTEKSKKTFPTVELRGYSGEAKVRCSLYQVETARRAPHSHLLVIKSGEEDMIDPHDVDVGPNVAGDSGGGGGGGYVATFQGMGIIHTAKKFIAPELYKKLRKHRLTRDNREPTEREEKQMQDDAAQMARTMNLNQVCLCFQAFEVDPATSQWKPLTEPVYSNAINNMKSALTGELKICRLSTTFSSVDGGEEVFMFVEKVCKNNIQIRFFELDEYETEVWTDKAIFSEADVHHQYAIAFKTPPYRYKDITEPVEVYMQLYRPKDHCLSEPVPFKYKPRAGMMPVPGGSGTNSSRKRLRMSSGTVSSEIPTVLPNDPNAQTAAGGGGSEGGGNVTAQPQLPSMHRSFPMLVNHTPDAISEALETAPMHGMLEPTDGTGTTISKELSKAIIQEILNIPTTIASDVAFDSSDFRCNTEEFNELIREIENQQDLVKLETDASPDDSASDPESSALVKALNDFLRTGDDTRHGEALRKLMVLIKLFAGNYKRSRQLLSSHWTASNQQQLNCLHAAIRRDDTTIAQMLIALLDEYGLTDELLDLPNDRNETALHLAVTANNGPVVAALLAAGAALNYCDYRGNTALHRAVVENVPEMVRLLLKHMRANGARMDSTNDDGLTPLQAAVYAKNLKITRILIDAGAPVCERDLKHGNNVLHIAVDNDSLDIVHYLLEKVGHTALGQERNNAGYTPLQLANARCHTSNGSNKLIVRELLRHDPDGLGHHERQPTIPRMMNPHGEDEEDEEDEEEEEEEEEDDAEEEEHDAGQNQHQGGQGEGKPSVEHRTTVLDSIDLNCDWADIARLLEDHKPETVPKESVAPKEPRSESTMFDERCLAELCRCLNVDGAWKELGSLLDFHAFFDVWELSSNPSRMLLDYYEMQTHPMERLIGMLGVLELRDAMRCIDEMICRKMK
ncbi:nuclear factor NF-kappa-B p110 subunit [Anopheles ziemanni]|uniref:nuclear factor NF-kappa-B p110 subunit n=1 Tax=Anopheles ziemanni TaxID=345580 RepID=UPI00265EE953|nr:nuclear factor NF-kappa-B p110 subunit [Anopheles ziemanni]